MEPAVPLLEVFWRPGCGYCSSLRRTLHEAGVDARWHNIWKDPDAAAYVRSVANGNETVPTVTYDDRVLVAPRPTQLLRDLKADHPELEIGAARPWPPLRLLQWAGIIVLLAASEALSRAGQTKWSWVMDAVAFAFFFIVRQLRTGTRREPPV